MREPPAAIYVLLHAAAVAWWRGVAWTASFPSCSSLLKRMKHKKACVRPAAHDLASSTSVPHACIPICCTSQRTHACPRRYATRSKLAAAHGAKAATAEPPPPQKKQQTALSASRTSTCVAKLPNDLQRSTTRWAVVRSASCPGGGVGAPAPLSDRQSRRHMRGTPLKQQCTLLLAPPAALAPAHHSPSARMQQRWWMDAS